MMIRAGMYSGYLADFYHPQPPPLRCVGTKFKLQMLLSSARVFSKVALSSIVSRTKMAFSPLPACCYILILILM